MGEETKEDIQSMMASQNIPFLYTLPKLNKYSFLSFTTVASITITLFERTKLHVYQL